MTAGISSQVAMLKNQTAVADAEKKKAEGTTNSTTDKNMFLKLMLKQMEYQDPTEPTSNEEWLSQLAQYSSLEEVQNTNTALANLQTTMNSLTESFNASAGISQTLSLLGNDVTLLNPVTDANGNYVTGDDGKVKTETISGTVEEASFDNGSGMIKVNGKEYPIAYIQSVKRKS